MSIPKLATLIDGSVLNNRPFGPAIDALSHRPAHREVDRRFVYVDPKPGMHADTPRDAVALPGFFATVLRSLADIPRHQPIADNLAAIDALSARIRMLRYVVEGMTPEVDTAIAGALGLRVFLMKLTPERLAEWRSRAQSFAARNAGFAYLAYGQLKVAQIVESLAVRLAELGKVAVEPVRAALWREIRARGFDHPGEAQGKTGAGSDYVTFLRSFDLEFRIRRLRFMIRRVNALAEAAQRSRDAGGARCHEDGAVQYRLAASAAPPAGLLRSRGADGGGLCRQFADAGARQPCRRDGPEGARCRQRCGAGDAVQRQGAAGAAADADQRLSRLSVLRHRAAAAVAGRKRRRVRRDQGRSPVPDDALSLRGAGGGRLKGAQFNAFGAFFSRAYREHDYLWGRLHGAERLIDIVCSALPDDAMLSPEELAGLKDKAFRAIIAAERNELTLIPDVFTELEEELASRALAASV